jgi:hypothetical protein
MATFSFLGLTEDIHSQIKEILEILRRIQKNKSAMREVQRHWVL